MELQESRYNRIEQDRDCDSVDCAYSGKYYTSLTLLRWSLLVNFALTLGVIGLGASFLWQNYKSTSAVYNNEILSSQLLEKQYGVSIKIPKTYEFFQNDFDPDDFKKGDPYWEALFPNDPDTERRGNGVVFLSDELVEAYRLPPAARHPQRGNRSVYEIAGYHSLHCLSAVRATTNRLLKAQETSQPYIMDHTRWNHIKHCIGDLRQYLLCNFDETLLVGHDSIHPGKDQTKLCRDLGPINKWIEGHYIPLE
ncbi:hypothetical protein F5884DRAFT_756310 [Xylogone sp. PMI_703]|nr:hypothetical protein F5884DRAFT_756310 [Xylogone sp. PMI_703]